MPKVIWLPSLAWPLTQVRPQISIPDYQHQPKCWRPPDNQKSAVLPIAAWQPKNSGSTYTSLTTNSQLYFLYLPYYRKPVVPSIYILTINIEPSYLHQRYYHKPAVLPIAAWLPKATHATYISKTTYKNMPGIDGLPFRGSWYYR